jgi:hypothetical protein
MALAVTSSSRRTTCGRLAPSPARKKRFTDRHASTSTDSVTPTSLRATSAATTSTSAVRTRLDTSRIWRRRQRSRTTPANGPITV